jgi:RES domain-containing protein
MSEAPIRVWRIVRASNYAPDDKFVAGLCDDLKAWSGGFAAEYPQRWNISGQPVAYAAESRALAAWEVFIHNSEVPELIAPDKHRIVCATFDPMILDLKSIVDAPPRDQLPPGWAGKFCTKKDAPPSPSQELAHKLLIDGNSLALRVPSVIIPGKFNYVINVEHPDFSKIVFSSPERFDFDGRVQRLVKQSRSPAN